MSTKILDVGDDANALKANETLLNNRFTVLCAGPREPMRQALEIWNNNPDVLLALIDLQQAEPDSQSEEVGFELIEQMRQRAGSIIIARSISEQPANRERAASLGVKLLPRTMAPDDLLAQLEIFAATIQEERTLHDHAWALTTPAVYEVHAGQVIAVCHQQVWGQGADHLQALESARQKSGCPDISLLTFVAIPGSVWLDVDLFPNTSNGRWMTEMPCESKG